MRISATSRSSSVCDTLDANSFRFHDPRYGDDLVTAHDERPRLACRTGDLCVHEHVLDLLLPSGEPVAGAPGPYLKAWHVGGDTPVAPADLAIERDGRAFEPDIAVLPDRRQPTAEVEPLRARRRRQQLVERGRLSLSKPEQVLVGCGMERAQPRQDLVADQPPLRAGVGAVHAEGEPLPAAVLLCLRTPE